MNTLFLKYAVEVQKTRSITKAAENLYMAQPNLSKAIKELEDGLGIVIFERTSRGVTPTSKGAEFLAHAKTILDELNKMERLNTPEDKEKQRIDVAIPRASYIAHGFTQFVAGLDMKKAIDLNLQETNSMQAIANVSEHHFNLGVIRYQAVYENYFLDYLEAKGLAYEPIWEFEYLALMSAAHLLANEQTVTYDALMHYIEITHGDSSVPYLPDSKLPSDEIKRRIYVYERCSQFDMLANIPQTFMWVSPIPEDLLCRYELVQRKCAGFNRTCKDALIYPKGYAFTPIDRQFIDQLFAAKNQVAFMTQD